MKQIHITGVIGWDSTPDQLRESLAAAGGADVEILISSPGGFVGDGLEMFNLVRNYKGQTVARISGYAMSMASYIPLAADRIIAEDNAVYMIHNVRGGVFGDHNEILKYGEMTQAMSRLLARAYAKRTGKSAEEVALLMDRESYFFGQDMVDAGFVDEVINSGTDEDRDSATATARFAFNDCFGRMSADVAAVRADLTRAAAIAGNVRDNRPPRAQATAAPADRKAKMMTLEQLRADHSALVAAIVAEATQGMISAADLQQQLSTARAEGAAAEMARIQAVEAQAIPGHEGLIATLKFDGKTSGDQAAAAVVAAEKGLRGAALAALESDTPPVVAAVEGDGGIDANAPIEDRAEAEWKKNPAIRGEFGKYAAYLAYRRKAEAGQVRILGKK